MQLLSVKLGSSAVVLLLGVGGVAVVRPEEGRGPGVAPELHLAQLLPGPVGVQVCRPDEGQVDAKRSAQTKHNMDDLIVVMIYVMVLLHTSPVNSTAVNADKNPIGDGGPSRIFTAAVKTHFVGPS